MKNVLCNTIGAKGGNALVDSLGGGGANLKIEQILIQIKENDDEVIINSLHINKDILCEIEFQEEII